MTLRIQDAVEQVRENLRLGGPDAALYVQLCLGGPAKASDLAEALHVHRNDVYRSAERLQARGLVETTFERPARYAAVDPDRVFSQEIDERLKAVESLRESRQRVMDILVQLHVQADAPVKNTYKVIQGRHEIHAARNRMIEHAESSILWLTSYQSALSVNEIGGGLDRLAEAAARGVDLKALMKPTAEGRARLESLLKSPTAAAREFSPQSVIRFFIVDGRELLMYVVNGNADSYYAQDEVALQTTAPGFVNAQILFFEQCWAGARPLLEAAP